MATQVAVTDEYGRNSLKKLTVHDTEVFGVEARMACSLIERWGMVAGTDAGEDSSGRAFIKCATPDEVVDRACTTAALAMEEFRKRNWLVTAPDVSELLRKTDD